MLDKEKLRDIAKKIEDEAIFVDGEAAMVYGYLVSAELMQELRRVLKDEPEPFEDSYGRG